MKQDELTLPAKFLTIETCCVRRTEVAAARMANLEAEENIMVCILKKKRLEKRYLCEMDAFYIRIITAHEP